MLYYLGRFLIKIAAKVFYRHKVIGVRGEVPSGAAIIAPNHVSFIDPPLVGISWPEEVHFLARATLFRRRWFAWVLRCTHAHPVTAGSGNIEVMRIISKILKNEKKVVVFPEGERSHSGEILPFQQGVASLALRHDVPIIPCYIHGAHSIWKRGQKLPKLTGRLYCVFGKPIPVPASTRENRKEVQASLTKEIEEKVTALKEWFDAGAEGELP